MRNNEASSVSRNNFEQDILQLCIIWKSHYEPKTLRFKFLSRDERKIELVHNIFNEIKYLSKTCEFDLFI